jgi:hypothetical protein
VDFLKESTWKKRRGQQKRVLGRDAFRVDVQAHGRNAAVSIFCLTIWQELTLRSRYLQWAGVLL